MSDTSIGIIGGSGLYSMKELKIEGEVALDTPFGRPSAPYVKGELAGQSVFFLARHGIGHTITPSELNARANIWGFKKLGVRKLLSVSAVGSLREEIAPGHLVVPDQVIDRTRGRASTFFEGGVVAHVGFAEPFCPHLRKSLSTAIFALNLKGHESGTYICMEGPAFSTKAESKLYRSWGGDVIGMTNLPEAKLAREAELCYATLALSTDYDCWREGEEAVSADAIVKQIHENVHNAQQVLIKTLGVLGGESDCSCGRALSTALLTDLSRAPSAAKEKLALLLERFY